MSAALAFLAGRGIQSALEPAGANADRIGSLWDVFLVVTSVVYVVVIIAMLVALFRRRRSAAEEGGRGAVMVVSIATGLTVLTLFGLLTASIFTGRSIAEPRNRAPEITVTGKQWWWLVEYNNPDQSKRITSANEITIPVGVPVKLHLRSTDVIHSFWVPNLHGKRDLIPGHDGAITIQADHPGVFRGQCAEFCGLQHAKMVLWVNALPRNQYAQWVSQQRESSKIPSTPEERKGQEVFMSSPCPLCHTIQGTDASGKTAPDLTHFGSRRSIAAGTVPNRRGYLGGWIIDPQHIKPGSQMPPMVLEEGELEPLLAYLESLK